MFFERDAFEYFSSIFCYYRSVCCLIFFSWNLRYTAASPANTPNVSRKIVMYVWNVPSVDAPLPTISPTPAVMAVHTGAARLTISRLALRDVFPTIEKEPRNIDSASRVSSVVMSLSPIYTAFAGLLSMINLCARKDISLACSAISCSWRNRSSASWLLSKVSTPFTIPPSTTAN